MDEILRTLGPGDRALDLGSRFGSYPAGRTAARSVRVDLAPPPPAEAPSVAARAERLPFHGGVFRAIVCNHSLEHFELLDEVLAEIGRVRAPGASLFVSVPDASTLCDRVYRWLGRGGGHVNPFTDAGRLGARIAAATGLAFRGERTLHTSFSFLNRRAMSERPPRRLLLLGGGAEWTLRWASYLFRRLDRAFDSRLSVYGWALYFGEAAPDEGPAWTNVCVRCGAGRPARELQESLRGIPPRYRCAACGASNFFTLDGG